MEDSQADAGLVREALEEHGVSGELLVISDGEAALQFAALLEAGTEPLPDLMLIDLNLPKRSGHDVLQAVRASGKCNSVTVIILSSSDSPADREDALRHGADDYFRKPLRLNDFLALGARLKQLLEDRRS